MAKKPKMQKIMEEELTKIKNYPRERMLYPLVYPNEIEEMTRRLRLSNIHYRTEKVFSEGKFVGYKIKIIEWGAKNV